MQIILLILALLLTILTFSHTITPNFLYGIIFIGSIAIAFESPSRQALVANIVGNEGIGSALNLTNISRETGLIVGQGITGFLIALIGIGNIYLINAISFIAIIIALLMMHASGEISTSNHQLSLHAIKEGVQFMISKTIIWSTILLDFFSSFFAGATALLPIFANDILHVGPQGLGILYAAPSIGGVLASIFLSSVNVKKQGKLLIVGTVCYALGTILFGLSKIFIVSVLALVLLGAGDILAQIIRSIIRQLNTPEHLKGRVLSIAVIFYQGGPQLGDFEAGAVAALFGAPFSVVSGGIITLFVIGVMSLKIPILRKYESTTHG